MELTSWIKMARFQTLWIQMRKNKPLDESRQSNQTSRTKWHFTPNIIQSFEGDIRKISQIIKIQIKTHLREIQTVASILRS
ncbi:hypothetical protein Hanom_Chr07g00598521 [Helianthus anomalus]